jgi:hypothetical protein
MDLKKLLLSLAVSVPLVASGCGDDGGGTPDGSIDPCADLDPNAEIWEMTALRLPDGTPEDVVGFNLDGLNTTEPEPATPENGCGFIDMAGGVDNSIGMLLPLIGELTMGELDIQMAIDDAIAEDAITIFATIKNYTGAGSTGVTLSLTLNGKTDQLQDVPATVDGEGNITAEVASLPLVLEDLPVGEDLIDLTIDISNALVYIPAPTNNTTVATIGGAVLYGDDTSPPTAFRPQIAELLTQIQLGDVEITIELVDTIMEEVFDMSSNGTDCDSLSLGAETTFVKVICGE